MEPWAHQTRAVETVLAEIAAGQRRLCLVLPTGGGKTLVACLLIERWLKDGLSVVLYTNRRALLDQLERVLTGYGFDYGVRAAGRKRDRAEPLQISSLPTEQSKVTRKQTWELHPAQRVIIDECFVGETLISVPGGYRRIDNMRPGDSIYNACGIGTVEAASGRLADDIYRLTISDGQQLTCTGNHCIFTGRGWREARTLADDEIVFGSEAVRFLWQNLGAAKDWPKRTALRFAGNILARADVLLSILCEEVEESDVHCGARRQDAGHTAPHQAPPDQSRRQRAIAALATIGTATRSGGWVGERVAGSDQEAQGKRLPDVLQDRRGKSGEQDRLRGGWEHPRLDATGDRREEDGVTGVVRVVNVSRLKPASPIPVFNLRVSGHPSFFANGVLTHNCHLQKAPGTAAILSAHVEAGAALVGLTATPVDIGHVYTQLVIAGVNSELRACGALVPAIHYGPDEPDMRHFKGVAEGQDLSEKQAEAAIRKVGLFGRVWDNFERINPAHKPTILFAPSVEGSVWFAEQFTAKGVRAAHIDGDSIWVDGRFYRSDTKAREAVLEESRDNQVHVLCNRFVLREGIDAPWLAHGIFATIFGSVQSYLQSGGRLLRAHPTLARVTIQDHGGSYWRHGSLNEDRQWYIDGTAAMLYGIRAAEMRENPERQPGVCPRCKLILRGPKCWEKYGGCGWEAGPGHKRSRPVVTVEGDLVELSGNPFKPRRVTGRPDGPAIWERMYWRSIRRQVQKKDGSKAWVGRDRTFVAAMALFARENDWGWPDRRWPLMPKAPADFYRLVGSVAKEDLR